MSQYAEVMVFVPVCGGDSFMSQYVEVIALCPSMWR